MDVKVGQVVSSGLLLLGLCFSEVNAQSVASPIDNTKAVEIYEQILTTRNPKAVLDILNGFQLEAVQEDSLRSYFYYYKGSAFGQLAEFDSALFYMEQAEAALTLPDNHPEIEIQILRAYGNINWARNFYHIALKNYEDALNISNQHHLAEFQISLLGNIAGIYAKLENLPLALEYSLKAEEISEQSGVVRPRSHMKIGTYLIELGRFEDGLRSLEKTREIIIKEGKDSIALGVNYINLAQAQLKLKRLSEAKRNLDQAEAILRKVGFEYPDLHLTWARYALVTNNNSMANAQLAQAKAIAYKQRDKDEMKKVMEVAKEIAIKENRLKDAIVYQDELYALNDSIKTDKMVNRVYELETQFKTEQKEAEIENLKLENLLKEANLARTKNLMIGLAVIGLLIIGLFILRNKKLKAEKIQQEFQMDALKQRLMELQTGAVEYDAIELESINTKIKNVLTERELETLKLVLKGKSNKEIGEKLFISVNTVKYHLKNIYEKIGVANRKEALEFALKANQ